MNTSACAESANLSETSFRQVWGKANHSMVRTSTDDSAAPRRMGNPAYIRNVISCLTLWISLLVAIWFVRGWIGLFFSGQVLSAGACTLQILARRTCHALSASK